MLIFIYGEDTYSSRQKLNELREKFLREVDPSGNDIVRLDGSTATMERINEAVSPSSLFSRKRMIVIENIFSASSKIVQDQLCDFLEKKGDMENIIIIWDDISGAKVAGKLFKFLSAQKFVQKFERMNDVRLAAWIRNEFEKKGVQIKADACHRLIAMFGDDLWRLDNEIHKLSFYKKGGDGATVGVDLADLNMLTVGEIEENIFALTDAISVKNKAQALALLENEIIAGASPVYLLQMILRQFKILLQVKELLERGMNKNEIVAATKLHPFVVQKGMAQAKNFSVPTLRSIFDKLISIDQDIKTGRADLLTVLDLIIVKN